MTHQPAADHGSRPAHTTPAVHVRRSASSERSIDRIEDPDHLGGPPVGNIDVGDRMSQHLGPTNHRFPIRGQVEVRAEGMPLRIILGQVDERVDPRIEELLEHRGDPFQRASSGLARVGASRQPPVDHPVGALGRARPPIGQFHASTLLRRSHRPSILPPSTSNPLVA